MKYMIANYLLNSAITLSYIPNLGKICIFPAVSVRERSYIGGKFDNCMESYIRDARGGKYRLGNNVGSIWEGF